jgi:hypothetical protein
MPPRTNAAPENTAAALIQARIDDIRTAPGSRVRAQPRGDFGRMTALKR